MAIEECVLCGNLQKIPVTDRIMQLDALVEMTEEARVHFKEKSERLEAKLTTERARLEWIWASGVRLGRNGHSFDYVMSDGGPCLIEYDGTLKGFNAAIDKARGEG